MKDTIGFAVVCLGAAFFSLVASGAINAAILLSRKTQTSERVLAAFLSFCCALGAWGVWRVLP